MQETIAKEKLQTFIKNNVHPGAFFTVSFTKKDFTRRIMTCRTGVDRTVKKVNRKFPDNKPYSHTRDTSRANITVWEIPRDKETGRFGKGQYRAVPLDRVDTIKVGGRTFFVC